MLWVVILFLLFLAVGMPVAFSIGIAGVAFFLQHPELPKTIIMSNKPSPAMLATDDFDEEAVRADLRRTISAAKRHGKQLEMILKDISTIRYDPSRLRRFSEIALEECMR